MQILYMFYMEGDYHPLYPPGDLTARPIQGIVVVIADIEVDVNAIPQHLFEISWFMLFIVMVCCYDYNRKFIILSFRIYSVTLYKFLTLLVDYYGGHRKMMLKVRIIISIDHFKMEVLCS